MTNFDFKNFDINLQLFAEKTEKATPKRREEAAKKGQIPRSPEINSVLVLLTAFLIIKIFTPYMIQEWRALTEDLFSMIAKNGFILDYKALQTIFILVVVSVTKILAPVVGGVIVAGVIASIIQVGFRFNMSLVAFNLENIDPIAGFKRMFGSAALGELVKSFLKITIVGYIAYSEYMKQFTQFTRLSDMNLWASSTFIGQATLNIVFKIILWLGVLAAADYIFQKWRHESQIKMSKQDIKDEFKQQEGDPQLKGKIKQKQRQMAMSRMMQALPKADVVITNPTHFAVALQYDSKTMNAPLIIAKGQDRVALRIKEIAREHNIVVVENKPLAQSLYHGTEIGDIVPAELFQAVAEVLAFVYKLKGKL